MKKNKKEEYIDDGHTIYSMDVDAKWARPKEKNNKITWQIHTNLLCFIHKYLWMGCTYVKGI